MSCVGGGGGEGVGWWGWRLERGVEGRVSADFMRGRGGGEGEESVGGARRGGGLCYMAVSRVGGLGEVYESVPRGRGGGAEGL